MVPPPPGGSAPPTKKASNLSRPVLSNPPAVNCNGYAVGPGNASTPLGARDAEPLDMSTVERRGQPALGPREGHKRNRVHNLQEAPVFHPTEEQFKDPMKFIQSIAAEGSKYGIVKVIPPDSWNPEFAIDTERFHFRTRRQELNSVEGGTSELSRAISKPQDGEESDAVIGTRSNLNYLDQLSKFHRRNGTNLNRFPSVDKRPLDLYKLKKAVEIRGGFDKVCKLKKWAEIGRDLGYSGKIMSSLSTSLKNSYQRWLHPYEEFLKTAKPGVHQQLEFENGGPLTPSPAQSPMKKSQNSDHSSNHANSPAIKASNALNSTIGESKVEASRPPPNSGFTAVNSGGFTAVNSASYSASHMTNGVKKSPEPSTTRSVDSPLSTSNNTPEFRSSSVTANSAPNGISHHLKRRMSEDSIGPSSSKDNADDTDPDSAERRSKRVKREPVPRVAGSHMSLFRPSTPKMLKEPVNLRPGERCQACKTSDNPKTLLLCDSCDHAYHSQCLDPPARLNPDRSWHCPRCLVGTGEFGFEDGGIYSLKSFQEKAQRFKDDHFVPKMPFDPILNRKREVNEQDVEGEFWRLVESLTETVEVEYGADIHSTTHGSGFPTIENNPLDPYSTDPWNLNILPLHSDSLFRHIKSDISGMTIPWLYVGMCFSTFCWHNEDHYTFSANYQHFGATKTWYGIPGEDAEKFEATMREAVPELFETQPDLLFQLVTLLPPSQLRKAGVRVFAADQRAGQFIITFPQAYHAGFNHGFNFNEAVNFAPQDWEPHGQAGVERLQAFRRQPCFSHDELLMTAASQESKELTIKTAKWLAPALERMRDRETAQRSDLVSRHKATSHQFCRLENPGMAGGSKCNINFEVGQEHFKDDEYQCSFCKAYTYLSRFQCNKTNKTVCLLHAGTYECCEGTPEERLTNSHHTLIYRMTEEQLRSVAQKVIDKARAPELWTEKYNKMLNDGPKPSLRLMKTLLHEGERIHFDVPDLSSLKDFVERCSEWVEEATNYIVRKQQNRRKNERAWRKHSIAKASEIEARQRGDLRWQDISRLLKEAEDLSFDCPEIGQLQERIDAINEFRESATKLLENPTNSSIQEIEDLAEVGRGFNVDIKEVALLDKIVQEMKWDERASGKRRERLSLAETIDLIQQATEFGIAEEHEPLVRLKAQKYQGEFWEAKAKELMSADPIHYQQLEALASQASTVPVSPETFAAVDQILTKQREAHKQIISLYERSKDSEFRNRPKYKDVRDIMETLVELNNKPTGTIDLEKEQKRHEDWMRKGKKLFGKANASLHILASHMDYVKNHNNDCFNLDDRPRLPVEPSSRGHSPENGEGGFEDSGRPREVFCICRAPEAGMMIECELCHEWYHSRCLKIARGKVKEDDKFKCPICDWRVKIPRDAARPKLEELQDWQAEIPSLPFQPDEEQCLASIINKAQAFRDYIRPFISPVMATLDIVDTQQFYLRKIEGAEILLAWETNFFRQELHRLTPVAPEPPPLLQVSLSTRKPRPTKLQKLMAARGLDNPNDLPMNMRPKSPSYSKRKSNEPSSKHTHTPLQSGIGHSVSPGSQTPGTATSMTAPPFLPEPGQPAFAFDHPYPIGSPQQQASRLGENAFLPSQMGSPGLDPPLFGGHAFVPPGQDLQRPKSPEVEFGSSQNATLDNIFHELTNEEPPDPELMGNQHANDMLATYDDRASDRGDDRMDMGV
ncbi:MAG: hypothetical protein M1814_002944 [Vezdaea aestivalis]|nr:MAG: hypothetical protein M1814_002944 [Vezdaea aestivalis]